MLLFLFISAFRSCVNQLCTCLCTAGSLGSNEFNTWPGGFHVAAGREPLHLHLLLSKSCCHFNACPLSLLSLLITLVSVFCSITHHMHTHTHTHTHTHMHYDENKTVFETILLPSSPPLPPLLLLLLLSSLSNSNKRYLRYALNK